MPRYWKSRADGVALVFASAEVVGEDAVIVVSGVGKRPNIRRIEKLNAGIGGPKKVDRTIGKGKNVVGWD